MAVILGLISTFIFLYMLHAVIRSAIDGSKLAKNIQYLKDNLAPADQAGAQRYEVCPSCGDIVKPGVAQCPYCRHNMN